MKKIATPSGLRPNLMIRGVAVYQGLLDSAEQKALVGTLRTIVTQAPLFRPVTARGQAMSVRMTSAGDVGWMSDRKGYRYEDRHPGGTSWPPIPDMLLALWASVSGSQRAPDSCLINFYDADARMGMHQDRDEADLTAPVVSISLGDDALFRIGNIDRGGRTESLWLQSGDVVVLGGTARLLHHGVDRIRPNSSRLLEQGGRINVTLRVAR